VFVIALSGSRLILVVPLIAYVFNFSFTLAQISVAVYPCGFPNKILCVFLICAMLLVLPI